MGDLGPKGNNIVGEHENLLATIVVDQLLHFSIHGGTLGLVDFATGGKQQFIEAGMLPMGVVPGGIGSQTLSQ